MLVIRLFRVGKRNQPFFRIVVTDKRRAARGGRYIEEVGFRNPLTKEKVLKKDRIKYWLSVGAKPSDSVYNLMIDEKIIENKKIKVHKKSKKEIKEVKEQPVAQEPKAARPETANNTVEQKEEVKTQPVEPEKVEPPTTEEKPNEAKPTEEAPKTE